MSLSVAIGLSGLDPTQWTDLSTLVQPSAALFPNNTNRAIILNRNGNNNNGLSNRSRNNYNANDLNINFNATNINNNGNNNNNAFLWQNWNGSGINSIKSVANTYANFSPIASSETYNNGKRNDDIATAKRNLENEFNAVEALIALNKIKNDENEKKKIDEDASSEAELDVMNTNISAKNDDSNETSLLSSPSSSSSFENEEVIKMNESAEMRPYPVQTRLIRGGRNVLDLLTNVRYGWNLTYSQLNFNRYFDDRSQLSRLDGAFVPRHTTHVCHSDNCGFRQFTYF